MFAHVAGQSTSSHGQHHSGPKVEKATLTAKPVRTSSSTQRPNGNEDDNDPMDEEEDNVPHKKHSDPNPPNGGG